VTERAITMGPVEVRAILEASKTQLRREIKPQPDDRPGTMVARCPYGVPGDRLWVRESFAPQDANLVVYRGDEAGLALPAHQWRSPQHMPRWASRLTLEVIDVRVERLTAITEADAIAEGMHSVPGGRGPWGPGPTWTSARPHPNIIDPVMGHEHCLGSARHAFGNAWIARTRDAGAWNRNTLVWAVTFSVASAALGTRR